MTVGRLSYSLDDTKRRTKVLAFVWLVEVSGWQ